MNLPAQNSINNPPAFRPALIPAYPSIAGLRVFVAPGSLFVNENIVTTTAQFIIVAPITTSYIYLDLSTGIITSAIGGFPNSDIYPIAIAATNATELTSLTDCRPDVFQGVGGGGGGTQPSVQAVSSNQTLGFAGSNQTLVKASAGGAGITLTMPTAVGIGGNILSLIQVDNGVGGILLNATSSQTFSGRSSLFINNQWQTYTLWSDNANWIITASFS